MLLGESVIFCKPRTQSFTIISMSSIFHSYVRRLIRLQAPKPKYGFAHLVLECVNRTPPTDRIQFGIFKFILFRVQTRTLPQEAVDNLPASKHSHNMPDDANLELLGVIRAVLFHNVAVMKDISDRAAVIFRADDVRRDLSVVVVLLVPLKRFQNRLDTHAF